MRYFNTSGPNIEKKHYTITRMNLIKKGVNLVKDERYFTIWAPPLPLGRSIFHHKKEQPWGSGHHTKSSSL